MAETNASTGIITDIHRTSTVDGPGIRTTVFTKGCPLRCVWCHNPETQSFFIEKGYGRVVSVDEIVAECLKDRVYYELSGGGVTLSGGEPLAQPEFTLEILRRMKEEGIHTTLDTTGYGPLSVYERSLEFTDLYLFDYKAAPEQHLDLVECLLAPILKTLDFLVARGANILLRCPMIPGLNDDTDHLQAIVNLESRYPGLMGIEVLPWHTMGNAKYEKLGIPLDPRLPKENVPQETNDAYREFFRDKGAKAIRVIA